MPTKRKAALCFAVCGLWQTRQRLDCGEFTAALVRAPCRYEASNTSWWHWSRCDQSAAQRSAGAADHSRAQSLATRHGPAAAGRQSRGAALATNAWWHWSRCDQSAAQRSVGAADHSRAQSLATRRVPAAAGRQSRGATLATSPARARSVYSTALSNIPTPARARTKSSLSPVVRRKIGAT